MPNRMFFAIFVSLCALNFDAFAATARGNVRGNAASANVDNTQQNTPVAARAASRQRVANTVNVAPQDAGNVVSARAGSRQKVANTPSAPAPVAARAASSQKVIQTGSKIASATANTVVSQECQDAFYGCMDSFCMLDNVSGGRCSCSNKNAELNAVLDDILKLDEQSYAMATEGVERIKLGENADEVIARAKAAGDKAAGKEVADDNKKKSRTLDLSAWNNNVFNMDDDIFEDLNSNAVSEALSKEGDALYREATKLCVGQIPTQCRNSLSMLQSVYAQKIKSDCMAYENSLKQQKSASAQKLQTAEKALREAALEKFNEENKYGLGQCQIRYAQCMQTTAGCGEDYSGCVTMAAAENVKSSQNKASKSKQTKIKGALTTIELAASTIDQLVAKKNVCDDEVLKYCVKVKDQVWNAFLTDAAPALKSAELMAEQKLRENCIVDVASCFNSACASQFGTDASDKSYDMCLSDPSMFVDLCKIKIEPCLEATGGSLKKLDESSLWNGVKSILSAMRVDSCTKEVKGCIESICGTDYAYCVGLNPYTIAGLCPTDTLTACKNENKGDKDAVLDYIADVAQGYALQINDKLFAQCENAAREAMVKVCGDADTCNTLDLGNMAFDNLLSVKLCKVKNTNDSYDILECEGINEFDQDDIVKGKVEPHIMGRININAIEYKDNNFSYNPFDGATVDQNGKGTEFANPDGAAVKALIAGLNNVFNTKMDAVNNDRTVYECMNGKDLSGFNEDNSTKRIKNSGTKNTQDDIFVNLTDSYQTIVALKTLELLREKYDQAEANLTPQIDALNDQISQRLSSIEGVKAEEIHKQNRAKCVKKAVQINVDNNSSGAEIKVDEDTGIITVSSKGKTFNFGGGEFTVSGDCNSDSATFCYKGNRLFFDTGAGRNKSRSALYWADAAYDETTSKCTITTTKYACTYYLSPYCWGWDTTGVQDRIDVEQMPVYNRERDLLKK